MTGPPSRPERRASGSSSTTSAFAGSRPSSPHPDTSLSRRQSWSKRSAASSTSAPYDPDLRSISPTTPSLPYEPAFSSHAHFVSQPSAFTSEASFDSPTDEHDLGADTVHLTAAEGHPRRPRRWSGAYASLEEGDITSAPPGGSPARGAALDRRGTLSAVSRHIKRISVRVVNLGSAAPSREEGMVRIRDEEDAEISKTSDEGVPAFVPPPEAKATALRGRTLGVFGSNNKFRGAMNSFLLNPITEPLILMLIVADVVVLTIQSSPSVYAHPREQGFSSWEDWVRFGLFCVFTLEAIARIVVSGLLLDPETPFSRKHSASGASVLEMPPAPSRSRTPDPGSPQRPAAQQLVAMTQRVKNTVSSTLALPHQHPSRPSSPSSESGGTPPPPPPSRTRTRSLAAELPFRETIVKQQTLTAQSRPYLRHSWNRVDALAIICFWVTFCLAITGTEATADRHLYIFRALSMLRAFRLLTITTGTTTILKSLKRAGPLLVQVGLFTVFAILLFSIVGVQSFQGSFRRECVWMGENGDGFGSFSTGQKCGGHYDLVTGAKTGYLNTSGDPVPPAKGFICPQGQVCQEDDSSPLDGFQSYDNVFVSALQVVIIASANTYSDNMYEMIDADYGATALFYLVALIALNFWLLNLVVAVITSTFAAITEETKQSAFAASAPEPILNEKGDGWTGDAARLRCSKIQRIYAKSEWFWALLIIVNIACLAAQEASTPQQEKDLLDRLEIVFNVIFFSEIVIRFITYLPDWRLFLHRRRNSVDLFLAIMTAIIQIPVIHRSSVYAWLSAFEIARFYRVIILVPRLRLLLVRVFGNFSGLANISVFLLLTTGIVSLFTVQIFRGDVPEVDDDGDNTQQNFKHVYNAFLAIYQVLSSENWTDVMNNAISGGAQFKQGAISAIIVCSWIAIGYFVLVQLVIAVINENFSVDEEVKRKEQVRAFVQRSGPTATRATWMDRFNPYRFVKAKPKALAVGNVSSNLVLPMQKSVLATGAKKGRNESSEFGDESEIPLSFTGYLRHLFAGRRNKESIQLADVAGTSARSTEHADITKQLEVLAATSGMGHSEARLDDRYERRAQQADFIAAHPTFDKSLFVFSNNNTIRRFCQRLVPPAYGERIHGVPVEPLRHNIFRLVIFLSICASVAVAAYATPVYRRTYYLNNTITRNTWFVIVEASLGVVFVIEFAVKIIADGFLFSPSAYLLSVWCSIDFFVLITLITNVVSELLTVGGGSAFTRSLKAFRALRFITLSAAMRETFYIVAIAGFSRILEASVLAILYMIPYAIWGQTIFRGLLFSCNDDSVSGKGTCVDEFTTAPVNDDWAYLAPRVWDNPSTDGIWSFDNFKSSLLILFEIVSLEGWVDVMQSTLQVTGRDLQPEHDASQWNGLFFVAYNLLGSLIIFSLFVSIIIANFGNRTGDALLTAPQRQWQDLQKIITRQEPAKRPKTRPHGVRGWCYDRAVHKHGWWSRTLTVLYVVHIGLLMSQTYDESDTFSRRRDYVFLTLIILYLIDILVRLVGLGWRNFFHGWSFFDLFSVTGSLATTLAITQGSTSQVNVQLQKLFLVSIVFKLAQRNDSLNQLLKIATASFKPIGSLFMLWATLFIVWAILMTENFSLTKWGNNGTHLQNYQKFEYALLMQAFMSTGEGWNFFKDDYYVSYPRCTPSEKYLETDCGSETAANLLFIGWNIISMYIFLNMFTAVIVQSFAYVYAQGGRSLISRDEMRVFKKAWAEFDRERTGYLQRQDFVAFFAKLSGVFDVKIYPTEHRVPSLLRTAREGVSPYSSNVVDGVDLSRLNAALSKIDYEAVRRRRKLYERLFHEALISEGSRGISFHEMLRLLAHYKLIDDDQALLLDELLERRAKTERVQDRVNLDRVQGLLSMLYFRRRYKYIREEKRQRQRAADAQVPAIFVEPSPNSPPPDAFDATASSAPGSPVFSPINPFAADSSTRHGSLYSPDASFDVGQSAWDASVDESRMGRRISSDSRLSQDSALSLDASPSPARVSADMTSASQMLDSMSSSLWGQMMHEQDDEDSD